MIQTPSLAAVILAAGKGTRMKSPLPKPKRKSVPLVPILMTMMSLRYRSQPEHSAIARATHPLRTPVPPRHAMARSANSTRTAA